MSTNHVLSTLRYVRKFSGETVLIKIGGAALKDESVISNLCEDLALIRSSGVSVVLVHGGGPSINDELTIHGIEWKFIEGQRVTTPAMMDIVEMVLCGRMNRKIVRTLNHAGVRAVGISGSDARMLLCKSAAAELGQVGVIESVDPSYLSLILNSQQDGVGCIPVIAPVGVSKQGEAMNINADWVASRVAQSLGIKKVIYLTDQDGILDESKKLISEMDAGDLEGLVESQVVQGGMLAKARTILDGLRNGVQEIHILNANRPHCLVEELFTDQGVGTFIRARSRQA
jgi:acetylglutamate kinase